MMAILIMAIYGRRESDFKSHTLLVMFLGKRDSNHCDGIVYEQFFELKTSMYDFSIAYQHWGFLVTGPGEIKMHWLTKFTRTYLGGITVSAFRS
jgi:hypothetical protein